MVDIVLSYPRSGNSWVRYFSEVVTGKPSSQGTIADCKSNNPKNDAIIHKTLTQPASLIKRHRFDFTWDNWDCTEDKILVLVRNYKECIIRNNEKECSLQEYQKQAVEAYIHIIESYVAWTGLKLLIYYEDLIINPSIELTKIGDFLDYDKSAVDLFIKNLSRHKIKSIGLYNPGSATQGAPNKLKFHSGRKLKSAAEIASIIMENKNIGHLIGRYS